MTTEPAPPWSDTGAAAVDELASFYLHLATAEFDGYCPLYADLARAMAADRDMLAKVVTLAPATKVVPILLNAAVHFITLNEPDLELATIYRGDRGDPWPPYRALLLERFDELAELTAARSVQTNEVARSAILLPALTAIHRELGRPLSLIEIGPSAGLNLLFDRYGYRYDDGREAGDATSPVQLSCEVRGPLRPPLDRTPPPVRSRVGIDLDPIDVHDELACRWLEACLWPLVPERAERLRAALTLARANPPVLVRGAANAHLEERIAQAPDGTVPCVVATWVLAYFSKDDRHGIHDLLATAATTRDVACVTSEYPSIAPWVPRPERNTTGTGEEGASLLGAATWCDGVESARPLAWTHAHGRWIHWLDGPSADPG